ncbi:DUF5682 family protein [Chitinivorax sp. B]|uniref:DUF5682 family protein n=1 Tax=Chitinivorax sp. B TaxID=2502235 RepID=UPI0010FA0861|nr:DUF5682 family protein [Chitinivorax sp. B]
MTVHYFGIRHHGPGCARALEAALDALQPDIVLMEGPPEADTLISLATDPAMKPPVALLIYPQESPNLGVFYPFATFSPEWRAIQHAVGRSVPLWFIDLPPTHGFAEEMAKSVNTETDKAGEQPHEESIAASIDNDRQVSHDTELHDWRMDPIGELSRAAGYADEEQWWEVQVEQRRDATDLFAGIQEAMTALRKAAPAPNLREARREAHMRSRIREAQKIGYANIAVVCGAWHVPALAGRATAKDDNALLKGLPRTKTAATWVPWSDDRLASESGYGAGVTSPGWYRHLWHSPDRAVLRWITTAARLMRQQGLDASSASVIESIRLAEALAAMRDLPMPGLAETREAMEAVLCHGDPAPLALIRRELEIGHHIGAVPPSAAAAPLQRDLEVEQKRLRLKPTSESKTIDLDLREDGGRARSRLLHRLTILGVKWGEQQRDSNRTGTFRESWTLRWQPELAVDLISASRYGNTIEEAASHKLCEQARNEATLPALTAMLDWAVLARLPVAISVLLGCVQNQAALAADLAHLMDALPPLARVARYGDVRGTHSTSIEPIIIGLVDRITVGLQPAASGIDEHAAIALLDQIDAVQGALDLLEMAGLRDDWFDTLQRLVTQDGVAPTARGFALRLLFDRQRITEAELAQRARLALSPTLPPADATGWLSGLLRGSGLLLLQHTELWLALDGWLRSLPHDVFIERLPLLRRAFADFTPAERRQMGDKVRHLGQSGSAPVATTLPVDETRAARVLPVLQTILGPSAAQMTETE